MGTTPHHPDETTAPASSGATHGGAAQQLDAPSAVMHLERFARSFEISARRWELVVYPSLFAFIVLAAYGFFLI